jgi:hypothetical protein
VPTPFTVKNTGTNPGPPLATFDDAGNLRVIGQVYAGGVPSLDDSQVTGGALVQPGVTVAPTGDPGGNADVDAVLAAAETLPASGGVVTMLPSAKWNIRGGQLVINRSGLYINAPGCFINAVGAGDTFRMYDSSPFFDGSRVVHGGGILGYPIVDGSLATDTSCAWHAGDILWLANFIQAQNFTAGDASIGVHLDNQYAITEQAYGRIRGSGNSTGVMFDNSADLSGQATGSFDRFIGDLMIANQANGDGVTLSNGALIANGRLGIYGNFGISDTAYSVLSLLGTNGMAPSGIIGGVLNIGAECNTGGEGASVAPTTITFDTDNGCSIVNCTGILDFSQDQPFTPCSTNFGLFEFAGPIFGDDNLFSLDNLNNPQFGQDVTANATTIFTQWLGVNVVIPTGNFTGTILAPGGFSGQTITLINTGSGTLTFAAAGTSNVADGTSDVLAVNKAARYVWNVNTSLWYRIN